MVPWYFVKQAQNILRHWLIVFRNHVIGSTTRIWPLEDASFNAECIHIVCNESGNSQSSNECLRGVGTYIIAVVMESTATRHCSLCRNWSHRTCLISAGVLPSIRILVIACGVWGWSGWRISNALWCPCSSCRKLQIRIKYVSGHIIIYKW